MSQHDSPLWLMNVPVLSTAHLTYHTSNGQITNDHESPWGFCTVLFPYGFMIYNDEDLGNLEDPEIPDDLRQVLKWAYEKGYDWIRFDADGCLVKGLPTYEHP